MIEAAGITIERLGRGTDPRQFVDCARLHTELIHHGTLPLLGERFLAELYRGLATGGRSWVWRAAYEGRTVGFLAGCADLRRAGAGVMVRCGPRLTWAALAQLRDRGLRRKLYATLRYLPKRRAAAETAVESSELLAIAVDPAVQGGGTGRELVARFEEQLRNCGMGSYVVSTNVDEDGSNAFYRRLGFVDAGTMPHHDLVLRTYRKALV